MPVSADDDRLDHRVAAVGQLDGRHLAAPPAARPAALPQLGHGPRQVVRDGRVEARRVSKHGPLPVDDRHRHRDRLRERLGDRTQPTATQDDPREPVVDLRGPLEPDRLDVEDDPEHRADDLVEGGRRRQLDERKPQPISVLDHRGRDRLDVAGRLDRHPGEPVGHETGHELLEGGGVLPERVRGGEQELVRLHPVEDVRDFHDVDRPDDPTEARTPGDEARLLQWRQIENVRNRHTGERPALALALAPARLGDRDQGTHGELILVGTSQRFAPESMGFRQ